MAEVVVPGIWRLGLGLSNAYLVEADDGLVVVDTGVAGRAGRILAAVAQAGRGPADVHDIVLTHQHIDHAGSLARLAAATGARVSVHALDAPEIRAGGVPRAGRMRGGLDVLLARVRPGRHLEAATVDHELVDGEVLQAAAGLRVVHTPGHTAGHVSLLWGQAGGVLFVGDAAANLFGRLGRPFVAEDWAMVPTSLARLAELEFETAVFGHGRVLRGRANVRFRRFVERLAA